MIGFDYPWTLLLLPLAALPLLAGVAQTRAAYGWNALIPRDAWSVLVDLLLRVIAATAIGATVLGLAQPYRGEQRVTRVGQGAEIVLMLDRSRSMDGPFAGSGSFTNWSDSRGESKAAAARRILAEFVRARAAGARDAWGLLLFSLYPIPFLSFTDQQEVVQAAIAAGAVGKGLGDTDIGRALLAGAGYFDERPFSGSRILLLISDGGARLDTETRQRIARALQRNRVSVYWIYLRGLTAPELKLGGTATETESAGLPEQSLHDYLASLPIGYRVYQVAQPEALQRAVEDIGRLEKHPIEYAAVVPKQDLAAACFGAALAAIALLLAVELTTRLAARGVRVA